MGFAFAHPTCRGSRIAQIVETDNAESPRMVLLIPYVSCRIYTKYIYDKSRQGVIYLTVSIYWLSPSFDDFDFDHQFIEAEKYDAKPTCKKFLGYRSGVAIIGDVIVGIENRDSNTNVRFNQKETLESRSVGYGTFVSEMFLLRKNMYDKMIIFRFASKNAFSPIICRFEDLQKPRFIELENFS